MGISEITANTLAEYKRFIGRGLAEHPESFRMTLEDDAAEGFPTAGTPSSFTLVAHADDGRWLGVVSFRYEAPGRQMLAHKGLLFRMYVAQEAASKGVGLALINALVKRGRTLPGLEQINLTVVAANTRAIGLYTRLGFETYGLERRSIKRNGAYADEALMVLML